jgi:simple sugar transport system substrate-binding protein
VKRSVFLVSSALSLSSLSLSSFCFLGCGESKDESDPDAEEPDDPKGDPDPNKIAVVVKITGIPWFDRMGQGVSDAADDLGIDAVMVGPSDGDDLAAEQVRIVEGLIEDNYGAIGIVPQDIDRLNPVIRRAREAGIVVVTHESPSPSEADWDIETIDNTAYAERVFTKMAGLMDEEGQFALVVGGFDVGLHNLWADQGLQFVQESYPNMTLVTARTEDREPCGEDADACYDATNKLLEEFPDLKGIAAFGSQGPIGAGRALRDLERDDVNVVGAAIPSQVGQLLEDGYVKAAYLWDPSDAGYAMIAVAHRILDGGEIETGISFPLVGAATVDEEERNIVFDQILEITADNAGDLGF